MSERASSLPVLRGPTSETPDDPNSFLEVGPQTHSLAYNPQFDISAYRELASLRDQLSPEEFQRRKNQLDLRTRHNLETALGERFNVEISQVEYLMRNGQLINSEHDEPFLEVLKRGQKHRIQFGNPIDHQREKAEVLGFERAQEILSITPEMAGTDSSGSDFKVIVISPRGQESSSYQHNFFDVYQKDGRNQVQMSRFTSTLTYEQFWQVSKDLDPSLPIPLHLTDVYFLSHPIVTDKPIKEIIQMFDPDENAMKYSQYRQLIENCNLLINAYLEKPSQKTFNALLNFADTLTLRSDLLATHLNNLFKVRPLETLEILEIESLINFYGSQPVRLVTTGCGLQSGFGAQISNFNPFSVAEFALNYFHCPECGGQIPSGRGITTCPHCGQTKEQAGSKC